MTFDPPNRLMHWWERVLCRSGRHVWRAFHIDDGELPIVRLYCCRRCGSIES